MQKPELRIYTNGIILKRENKRTLLLKTEDKDVFKLGFKILKEKGNNKPLSTEKHFGRVAQMGLFISREGAHHLKNVLERFLEEF